jgi:hypothetical protein
MASSLDPSLRYCLEDRRSRQLARRLWSQKAIAIADLKPDEESVAASYPLRGAGTPRTSGAGHKFSRHTIRQVENLARRIDSRSGDPNMQDISTQGARVLITTLTSKA